MGQPRLSRTARAAFTCKVRLLKHPIQDHQVEEALKLPMVQVKMFITTSWKRCGRKFAMAYKIDFMTFHKNRRQCYNASGTPLGVK